MRLGESTSPCSRAEPHLVLPTGGRSARRRMPWRSPPAAMSRAAAAGRPGDAAALVSRRQWQAAGPRWFSRYGRGDRAEVHWRPRGASPLRPFPAARKLGLCASGGEARGRPGVRYGSWRPKLSDPLQAFGAAELDGKCCSSAKKTFRRLIGT